MVFDIDQVIEQLTTPEKISLPAGISIAIDGADTRERLLATANIDKLGVLSIRVIPREVHADSSFLMNPTV